MINTHKEIVKNTQEIVIYSNTRRFVFNKKLQEVYLTHTLR